MMKKTTKKVQDTGAVKVIPPYPRWVKICFALVWVLLIVFSLLIGVLEIEDVEMAGPVFGLFLLTLLLVSGYGIYRAFRYFPRRAFCVLALLVIVGGILLLLPAWFRQRFLKIFFDSSSIIFLVLDGLIVGQGILALFGKKARNFGWLISYTVLFAIIAITGQVYDYVRRGDVGRGDVGRTYVPGQEPPPAYFPASQVEIDQRVSCDDPGIVALQINPDESITIINKGVLDTQRMGRLKKGAFEVVTFNPGDVHGRIPETVEYEETIYQGIENGKAVIRKERSIFCPELSDVIVSDVIVCTNSCLFEIAPFTLVDYANTPEKEQEVWFGIAHLPQVFTDYYPPGDAKRTNDYQMIRQFIDHWAKSHEETELKKIVNQIFLSSGVNMALQKLLLDVGADVNAVDSNGKNALFHIKGMLHYSSYALEVGVFLISNGLDLYHKNNQGQTVIDILEKKKDDKDVKHIIEILKCAANPDDKVIGNRWGGFSCLVACPLNSFRYRDDQCVSCDAMDAIETQEEECDKCGDKRFMEGKRCVLSDCGEGKFRDESGNCVSCSSENRISSTAEECAKCVDKNGNPIREMYGKRCGLIKCSDGEFEDRFGNCVPCSSENGIDASDEDCTKCVGENGNPMREMFWKWCKIKCHKGEFRDRAGNCVSCSSIDSIRSFGEECAKCVDEGGNPMREMHWDSCRLMECPKGAFKDNKGECEPCDRKRFISTSPEECAKCVDEDGNPMREMYGERCGLK